MFWKSCDDKFLLLLTSEDGLLAFELTFYAAFTFDFTVIVHSGINYMGYIIN